MNSRMMNMADPDDRGTLSKFQRDQEARVHAILEDPEMVAALKIVLAKGHRRDAVHQAYSVIWRNRPKLDG